ncbi:MAG TPA: hypothetical protein VIF11_17300 [Methylomirabilota bacterium]
MATRFLRLGALALTLVALSATSQAADRDAATGTTGVTLYEVSERVSFDQVLGVVLRNATSPLQGFAALGTPLCPSKLLISTVTGMGPVSGTFDVVVNAPGNSAVHVPDLPVISGTFSGTVHLSLAVLHRILLGSIAGSFTITQTADPGTGVLVPLARAIVLPFAGTFRMPVALDAQGRFQRSDRDHAAFYLEDDLRTIVPVRTFERPTGFPDVRLEVSFGT